MKKLLIPFLFAGVLSVTSCTESFEPTVDYGDQTYINDYSALVAAVNNLNKSMSERFEALNLLLDKNMADVKLAIDGNTGAIKVIGSNMENGLSSINTTLFNGFSTLSTQIDETGKQIVYAINTNGELLRLEIDETGKLISSKIEDMSNLMKALISTINSQTTTLGQKFDALTKAINSGFANVTAKIGEVGDQLHLDIEGTNAALGDINTTMFEGFTLLGTKIDTNGKMIADAIDEQGNKLVLAIDANGKVISAEIKNFKDAYATAEALELGQMAEIVAALNALKTANNDNSAALIKKLEELLTDKGIYYDKNNSEQMYMTPEKFATIQDAGSASAVYKIYADQLTELTISFTSKQVVDETGHTHDHAVFTPNTAADAAPVLVASRAEVVDGIANGKTVVRVVKTAVDRNYIVTIASCSHPFMFAMRLTDAKGCNDIKFGSNLQSYPFQLLVYDAPKGVIKNEIDAIVYCVKMAIDAPYDLVDPLIKP